MSDSALLPGFRPLDERATVESKVALLPPADVIETLSQVGPVDAVILDPWYNKGVGGLRLDYDEWLATVVERAAAISPHIFVWGFPEIVCGLLRALPINFELVSWLTWYYKNCPSVIRGWRSAQNACLHLARIGAPLYHEHFLNAAQHRLRQNGKLRYIPGPPNVIEVPLNIGFVGRGEQTGHPSQKPVAVFDHSSS